jgi:hypothetical protein
MQSFIYEKFGISREGNEYSAFLNKCDISFCPTGQSPETYRLYESALSKCVLFGTPLPYTEYYKECPIISIPWQEFNTKNTQKILYILENILSDKNLQLEAYAWATKWLDINFLYASIVRHLKNVDV